MVAVQLLHRVSFLLQQVAFRARTATVALRTLSSLAWGSFRTTKSLNRILLVSFLLAQLALLVQKRSLIMSASFAQNKSFESFTSLQPSFCIGSLCFSFPASASKMSLASASSAASELAAPAGAALSFSHEETVKMQLANEAFALPEALLDHALQAELCNKNGEAYPKQLPANIFKQVVPKLDKKKLRFWLLLHQEAFEALKASGWKKLPQQRCPGSENANLGNFQASSSFSKQLAFFAWIVNRYDKLSGQPAYMVSLDLDPSGFVSSAAFMQLGQTVSLDYRASDTQLCFWGKLDPKESQPSFEQLGVDVGGLRLEASKLHKLAEAPLHHSQLRMGSFKLRMAACSQLAQRQLAASRCILEAFGKLGPSFSIGKAYPSPSSGSLEGAAVSFTTSSFVSFAFFIFGSFLGAAGRAYTGELAENAFECESFACRRPASRKLGASSLAEGGASAADSFRATVWPL